MASPALGQRFFRSGFPLRAVRMLALAGCLGAIAGGHSRAGTIILHCPESITPVLTPIKFVAGAELDLEIKVLTEGGSSVAILAVGDDQVDVGVMMRKLTAEDRALYPEKRFSVTPVAYQVFALAVNHDVWDAGVREITKPQAIDLYEETIRSWKLLGGADQPVKFFNPERGSGAWEQFVKWMYGEIRKAPLGNFETVASWQDARTAVEFHKGAMSVVPPVYVDYENVYPLSILGERGQVSSISRRDVVEGRYPLARPVCLITGERATGDIKRFLDYMSGPRGQELLTKAGLMAAVEPGPLMPKRSREEP